jgi:molybdopterin synthase sulfur carrier subunit
VSLKYAGEFDTGGVMNIEVRLFAHFTRNLPQTILDEHPQRIRAGRPFDVEVPEGTTVGELADRLALPRDEIKVTFVNGRARSLEQTLEPGDQVGIFPPVGGG